MDQPNETTATAADTNAASASGFSAQPHPASPPPAESPEPIEVQALAEFFCWTIVALTPMLTWINGPSVSTDQFVVRTAVFGLALAGGVGLRVARFFARRRRPPDRGFFRS